ncbi:penicillin-binding protein 1C [Afifella sp. IM 167]|uniref:penicillin-binding protein 1C n=1 Tax=Afifella sp. IM 167 TaxID=2033586 RepID=UPI001CCEE468|nr:penicillin-binding protein 1C [Afifella sp. IM 167]MBZ8132904.1 penicillin-binding protein 1C [Afifella sp. IM 167]
MRRAIRRGLARPAMAGIALACAMSLAAPAGLRLAVVSVDLPDLDLATSTLVVDRNGTLLRPFPIGTGIWRLKVGRDQVDPVFFRLLKTYEDRRFDEHHGVDLRALARAGWQAVTSVGIVSGGSTLTMQVARLLSGENTRSLAGKLRQILLARALENRLSKDEIVGLYLLAAPYGGNIEGVRAASLAYFGKEPGRLTAAEAALLVAIPQSPEARRPDRHAEEAREARDRVLARAARAGALRIEVAKEAIGSPAPSARKPFPMLAAHVAAEAAERAHESAASAPGAAEEIRLSIDAGLQQRLERLAARAAKSLGPRVSVAILAADHGTGEILASVGSADPLGFARAGFIDMTRAERSPGSSLKPLIYGLSFELGLAHPESLIEDRPTAYAGYAPASFDGEYRGTVTVRRALQLSLNVPAVTLLEEVGPTRLLARMRRAGVRPALSGISPPGLAIGLGGLGVTLEDLVTLSAAIARGGEAVKLRLDPAAPRQELGRILSPAAAWQVADILSGAPTPLGARADNIAFKTGTSWGYRDAWAVGFDGRHVVGVWAGRADATPVPGLVGIEAAAPIMLEAFSRLGPTRRMPPPPAGILQARSAALPPPLRFAGRGEEAATPAPEIAYPPDGARIDLGLSGGAPQPLAIKLRDGAPPFTWFLDGRPVQRTAFRREITLRPQGPGFADLMVLDRAGKAARVRIFLE